MGCQGKIYVIYGVKVKGKCEWEASPEGNPVVYSVNGRTITPCEDLYYGLGQGESPPSGCPSTIDYLSSVPTTGYGASNMEKAELAVRVLGHSTWMGARHATDGFGACAGKSCQVANECYIDKACELPKNNEIVAQGPRLIAEIKKEFGLDIELSELRPYLLFDYINGM